MNCYRLGLPRTFRDRAHNLAPHFRGADGDLGGSRQIPRAIPSAEHRGNRSFDAIRFSIQVERVTKHHGYRKNGP
jgi:hypothetical protein